MFSKAKRRFSDPYESAKLLVAFGLGYLFLFAILPGFQSMLAVSRTVGTLQVTPAMRSQIVEALANNIGQHYLDADKARRIAADLRTAGRKGDFDDTSSPSQLANRLTSFLYLATHDEHIRVDFQPGELHPFPLQAFWPRTVEESTGVTWLLDRLGRYQASFGVARVTQSAAGIGYLKLDAFFPPALAAEKFAAAMNRLRDSRAIIIDLRENSGGHPLSVALLASYFFDQPRHLSDIVAPRTGEKRSMWTSAQVDGARYGEARPVYILTSRHTFSAAEDFAYAMQKARRATVVGEVTRGGAHPTAAAWLGPHFIAIIPVLESISAATHANWEGSGVQPDLVVRASGALEIATSAILKSFAQ